jgi:hypothetical protein
MDRSSRNPAALPGVYSDPRNSPTEQDVYATGALFRGIAATQGHNSHPKVPLDVIQFPNLDVGALLQNAFIALRHST